MAIEKAHGFTFRCSGCGLERVNGVSLRPPHLSFPTGFICVRCISMAIKKIGRPSTPGVQEGHS